MIEVAQSIAPQRVTNDAGYLLGWIVHDSVAGFLDKLNEFKWNKLGAAKFRTVFKGSD